jgi:NadR type nicotinamide-nucleotide adenylyltransferase
MHKIAVTGPESSGKTTLVKALAAHFNSPYTEEFARAYLEKNKGKYDQHDLLPILKGQIENEDKAAVQDAPFLFCDTDPLVIMIWSEFKYGTVDPLIDAIWKDHQYSLRLLVYPDTIWEYDPLRENKEDRKRLYDLYYSALKEANLPFVIIKGSAEERVETAVKALKELSK